MSKPITQYSLKKASEHIYYEAWMFYETAEQVSISKRAEDTNTHLDAFAIHTRNLFNFLYPNKTQKKKDDIWVTDYIQNKRIFNTTKTKKSKIKFILRKAAKQVGHLTYKRNRYNTNNKGWPVKEIVTDMHKTLQAFYDNLPENQKKWPYFVKLNDLLKEKKTKFHL